MESILRPVATPGKMPIIERTRNRLIIKQWIKEAKLHVEHDDNGHIATLIFNDTFLVTDTQLARIRHLKSLRNLYLTNTKITDAGLVHLKEITSLRWLYLHHTRITDAGLVHLKGLKSLEILNLDNTKTTDVGLGHLTTLESLRYLYLTDTRITDAGLVHLKTLESCSHKRRFSYIP